MGEEVKKEEPHAEAKSEKEEKTEDKEEEEPKPPCPLILSLDLHCPGCAKKIKGSIMKIRGVEGVVTDMAQNQVIIKGVVDPQTVCAKIMKRIKKRPKILSPLPSAEGEPLPEIVTSQVISVVTTVELSVNMHCAACAEQLKKKILRMRGVQTATTELSTGKVTVTGTMDANKLVEYVYRRTKKQAMIVPQPEPEPEPEKKDEVKPAEEENKQENNEETTKEEEKQPEETKKEEVENKETEGQEKKEENAESGGESKAEPPKKEEEEEEGENSASTANPAEPDDHEENRQRMIHYYQPVYVIERIPPPQIFSDENPNACCIS